MVIGLNLCPFARRVFEEEKIRYVVSMAEDEGKLLTDFATELGILTSSTINALETTLLIHPGVLADFLDYNEFVGRVENSLREKGHEGVIQVAGFHPDYRFAGTSAGAVENYTNRSPYPMLHLLREESVSAVADDPQFLEQIPRRNIATLRGLVRPRCLKMLEGKDED